MIDKLAVILTKPGKKSGNGDDKNKKEDINYEKEYKKLKKENEKLKSSFAYNAIDTFKTRRSVRKYSTDDIDYKIIHSIIEAGINAPCAGNILNWTMIIIHDKDLINECAKVSMQQYWIADAPYLIAVIRDVEELKTLYPDFGKTYSVQNCAAAIENMLMAAHFHGLGACWVACNGNEIIRDVLAIPPGKILDAIIPIGYPMEKPSVSKPPLVGQVFFEKWGEKTKNYK